MRLLNTFTLQPETFVDDEIPHYAILSHTWGKEEVSLQDLLAGRGKQLLGYLKIEGCCKQAKSDGFHYVVSTDYLPTYLPT